MKRIERLEKEVADAKISQQRAEHAFRERRLSREEIEHQSRLTTIPEILDLYNQLFMTINVKEKPMVLTSGDISVPTRGKYPERIIPWDDFAKRQQEIWNIICASSTYSEPLFGSLGSIGSRRTWSINWCSDLISKEKVAVLDPVEAILEEFFNNDELRQKLHLLGGVSFIKSRYFHPGNQERSTLTPLDQSSKSEGAKVHFAIKSEKDTRDFYGDCQPDKLCILNLETGQQRLLYGIEYKLPCTLLATDIVQDLRGEILPGRYLMSKDDESLEFYTRREVFALITGLFSYLVKTGVQYGYVSTGDIMIFLHISDDPEQIEYHVWNPRDFDFSQPSSLHNTALAEVIAFSLQALTAELPLQAWHDAAANLETWAVEGANILECRPESVQHEHFRRNMPANQSSQSATPHYSSSTALRLKRRAKHIARREEHEEDDEPGSSNLGVQDLKCWPQGSKSGDESEDSTDEESRRIPAGVSSRAEISNVGRVRKKRKLDGDELTGRFTENSGKRVLDRDYCSLPCLLGLARGGDLDHNCPNIADHGKKHLTRLKYQRLVQEQLARDRGHHTDCEPLWIGGSRGAMFKVTLTAYGYTVIAKGVRSHDVPYLIHEAKIYRHLQSIQGIHIPVCLGSANLILPYYYQGAKFVRFLFQSYAGVPVSQIIHAEAKADILSKITYAVDAIHRLSVLHRDLVPRNIMTDAKSGSIQIIDFERAEIREKKIEVVSSRKKLLLRARSANDRITSPTPSPPKEYMAEETAGHNCEEVTKKGESVFDRELGVAILKTEYYVD